MSYVWEMVSGKYLPVCGNQCGKPNRADPHSTHFVARPERVCDGSRKVEESSASMALSFLNMRRLACAHMIMNQNSECLAHRYRPATAAGATKHYSHVTQLDWKGYRERPSFVPSEHASMGLTQCPKASKHA